MAMKLNELIKSTESLGGSDLHLVGGSCPMIRVNGELRQLDSAEVLDQKNVERLCFEILDDNLMAILKDNGELNLSHSFGETSRYRVNIHFEGGTVAGHFRKVPTRIPNIDDVGLPKLVTELTNYSDGIVIISGPTSSGRTTTAASLIANINENRPVSVMTVENPIEFEFKKKSALIRQREVGRDVLSIQTAVQGMYKQDVDVVYLADCTTREDYLGLTDAGTSGVLVLATTFANSAVESIDNYLSHVKEEERSYAARTLSNNLRAVINQRLLPGTKGKQVLAYEILLPTPEVRRNIREQTLNQLHQSIRKDQHKTGMVTLNQSLMSLLIKRSIELRSAFSISPDPEELDQLLKKAGI